MSFAIKSGTRDGFSNNKIELPSSLPLFLAKNIFHTKNGKINIFSTIHVANGHKIEQLVIVNKDS